MGITDLGGSTASPRFLVPALLVVFLLSWEDVTPVEKTGNLAYKRVHPHALDLLLRGEAERAESFIRDFLARYPGDAESLYILARIYAREGKKAEALQAVEQALAAGLPPARFVGGSLGGFDLLEDMPRWKALVQAFAHRPVHGPMLGSLTDHGVRVWVRTAEAARVRVRVAPDPGLDHAGASAVVETGAERDYTAVLSLDGLSPGTTYYYAVEIDGVPGRIRAFRTFPPRGAGAALTFAFGGGAGYVPSHERVWDTIRAVRPSALLLLGDNVYIDAPESPFQQRYHYYRRQSRPEFQRLVSGVPVFAVWDDHDFGTNDCVCGPERDDPPWKQRVLRIFQENWVNPAYGGGKPWPGCWFDFYAADLHFILLDGRYYRTLEGRPSMLGPAQKAWLFDTLRAHRATFTLLCSPVPWNFRSKGSSKDTWNGFREERAEIFRFLVKHRIEGVVLLSADRHRSDLWKIPWKEGYPLYECESSRLTNQHTHRTLDQALFSYNAKPSFGLLAFDTRKPDPTLTYRIVDLDGREVFRFTIRRSELCFPE